jgi:hypothetical protein
MKKYIIYVFLWIVSLTQVTGQNNHTIEVKTKDYRVATSAAYELVHIAIALCDTNLYAGKLNIYFNNVDTSTAYYKEVQQQFGKYSNHPFVRTINTKLKTNIGFYIFCLQQAYSTALLPDTAFALPILQPSRKTMVQALSFKDSALLNFAKDINFFSFYEKKKVYYTSIVKTAENNLRLDRCKQWLEKQFPKKYDWYDIAVSPLMGGMHFTNNFEANGKATSMMWVSAYDSSRLRISTTSQSAGIYTGVVFTEIDHNYVNPVSDQYIKELNTIFGEKNRDKWIKADGDGAMYETGYKVFNEYMTHAVYLLYISDYFSPKDTEVIVKTRIKMMEERRKYYRFGDFYRQLNTLYQLNKQNKKVADLYPAIIGWANQ